MHLKITSTPSLQESIPSIRSGIVFLVLLMVVQVAYKDNPTILGWDLANEPSDPGFPSSKALQSWIEEMSSYVKELDPKHLVMIGWEGNFGLSTPDKTRFNRMRYVNLHSYDLCVDILLLGDHSIDWSIVHCR